MDKHEVLDSTTGRWLIDSTRIGITGYVVYDGKGHMGVQQLKMPGDTSENIIDIVYFSTYAINENEKVVAHTKLTSSFDDVGSTVKRNFEFVGDTLILTPQESEGKLRIRWVRVFKLTGEYRPWLNSQNQSTLHSCRRKIYPKNLNRSGDN
ncbi:MAG: hypothetical protein WDN75_18210 [Bacteroidota bacterium]